MDDYISRQAVKELTTCRNSIWNTITDSQGRGLDEILDSIPSVFIDRKNEVKDDNTSE
jgi:hypothetical protein